MKRTLSIFTLVLAGAWLASPQTDEDRRRIPEFQDQLRRGEPVYTEYRAYMAQFNQRERVEYPKTHPSRESTGMIPLTDLGKGTYRGEQGGLYPGGENVPPATHEKAGMRLARSIRPLDAEGRPSRDGKVVMISIGMSNAEGESDAFLKRLKTESGINPKFIFVNCAESGQIAIFTSRADTDYWPAAEKLLAAAGITPQQVQVAWVLQANAAPLAPFPVDTKKLQSDLANTVRVMHAKYPNLKIVYLSSRIYAGYATFPLNPEPYAYESGFAVKWLIADQIAGHPDLNYDSARGRVEAPWLAWGPYLWADGLKARSDGLTYSRADVGLDGTHPTEQGAAKVAGLLLDFLRKDATARGWFAAR